MKKMLVIGSGPIVIGQATESDYAGSQARQSLREEGYEVTLINSSPATTMINTAIMDRVYIEPLTLGFASHIIYKERPDVILGSPGRQAGLNLVVGLAEPGILEEYDVRILGMDLATISKAEDRELFRDLMYEISEPASESNIVHTTEEAITSVNSIGYPVVVRPVYTLGGAGGGSADTEGELRVIADNGLKLSPIHQCLIEHSIAGFKEIEYEVMRNNGDNTIVVCNMEDIGPVDIHTGDSVVVAPVQTLSDHEHQVLRNASLEIIRALEICGGYSAQLVLGPDSFEHYIIEVDLRVSRSSTFASKATGYPVAKLAVKIAVGITLDEIINPTTKTNYACFEPLLDCIATKLARFPLDKFERADRRSGTQMEVTGGVISIGRNFEESFPKAVRSLEMKCDHIDHKEIDAYATEQLWERIAVKDNLRMFGIAELIRRKESLARIHEITKTNTSFLYEFTSIISLEKETMAHPQDLTVFRALKENDFVDSYIARKWGMKERSLYKSRRSNNIVPVHKMVDTCAAESESATPHFYSTCERETESSRTDRKGIVVLGSGLIRIGQGVEPDYATVHCVMTLRERGYRAIVINNNPEAVSTDFSTSDKLYFELLTTEGVIHVMDLGQPLGVITQFGGQTAIDLVDKLVERGVKILGTSLKDIDRAGDRYTFEAMLHTLDVPQPQGGTAMEVEEAINIANRIGYPILVCPSYVLGGCAMKIVHNDDNLRVYMATTVKEISHDTPILVDKYVVGKELEIDAICDGEYVYVPRIMEHIERAGIHSGDSVSVYLPQTISDKVRGTIVDYSIRIGKGFHSIGLFNIQFIVETPKDGKEEIVYVLEVNPRSSRTVSPLNKITGVAMSHITTRCVLSDSLAEQGYEEGIRLFENRTFAKTPVFSFTKLRSVGTVLGPETESTGEVLGDDITLEKALYKALLASGTRVPNHGSMLMAIADDDKEEGLRMTKRFSAIGYGIHVTSGTAEFLRENGLFVETVDKTSQGGSSNVLDVIRKRKVNYVANTMFSEDKRVMNSGFLVRRVSAENNISCFTSFDTTNAILKVLEALNFTAISMNELEH